MGVANMTDLRWIVSIVYSSSSNEGVISYGAWNGFQSHRGQTI